MKLNGTLILILVVALAAVTGVAWTEGEEKRVCPLTGETAACAGDGPHGPHGTHGLAGGHHQPERMAAALDLTDEQRAAMREIMAAEREATRDRMETALADILTPEQQEQLNEVKARCEARGDGERPGRMGRRGRRGPDGGARDEMATRRLERMTGRLDLTPDQQDRIRHILEESTPPRSEIRDRIREVLTLEQLEKMDRQHPRRPGMGDMGRMYDRKGRDLGLAGHPAQQLQLTDEQREEVREMMSGIRTEQRSQTRSRIEALLTPEQLEKLEQLHK